MIQRRTEAYTFIEVNHISVWWADDGERWCARHPDFPDLVAYGRTIFLATVSLIDGLTTAGWRPA